MATPQHWKRYLFIPCAAFAAAALHPATGWAESPMKLRAARAELTEAQKQQLFEARRQLVLGTYDQRLAILQAGHRCAERAQTYSAGQACREQQQKARRRLIKESRQVMNRERQRLGLSSLPAALPLGF